MDWDAKPQSQPAHDLPGDGPRIVLQSNILMKSTLILTWLISSAVTSVSAEEMTRFPSPDGKFLFFMGAWEARHFDSAKGDWVTDSAAEPAAVLEAATKKVVLRLETPFRPEEDKAIWNAGSDGLALSHRGNKMTELKVLFLRKGSFKEAQVPELPEVELKIPPPQKPDSDPHLHFDHDTIAPLRWLKSGELVVSRDKSVTDTTAQEITYRRTYLITIGFDAKGVGSIKKMERQKQTTQGRDP